MAQFWSSRFGFLMASIGFAVGLGNIWRFPYVTGENGGSAFVVVYLLCAFGIGVPILMAELMLGRSGRATPPTTMSLVATSANQSSRWSWLGYLNLATAFLILVAYGVVAGWVLYYLYIAVQGGLVSMDAAASTAHFEGLLASVGTLVIWTMASLAIAGVIIYGGVQKGIERAVTVLMPLLFALLLGLAIYNGFAGGMRETVSYLFAPDFDKLNPSMVLAAVGQAFFSIGVAMAGMMMFGAYLPQNVSIGKSALIIVTADTMVAILAGLVIFPMVFNNGLDPAGGTGLIFQTLPVAFANMQGGYVVGVLFFLLLSVAAITSVVGLCEPLAAWLSEQFGASRKLATFYLMLAILLFSLVSVLSYNHWQQVYIFGLRLVDFLDYLPNQIFLPLGGLLIAFFVGWRLPITYSREGLALGAGAFRLWHLLLSYIVTPVVLIILVAGIWS